MLGVLANGTSRPASCYLPWERNVWTETRGLVDGSEEVPVSTCPCSMPQWAEVVHVYGVYSFFWAIPRPGALGR